MTLRALGVLALVVLNAAGGTAQADPRFKNVALVNECRSVMERAPSERTRYLQLELFNYEMSFLSQTSRRDRDRLEENLLETCQVVATSNGLGRVEVALSEPAPAGELLPFYRVPASSPRSAPRAMPYPGRAIAASAVVEIESPGSSWKGTGFQPGVSARSLRSASPSIESTSLRGLLHLQ